jgi:biopolymer transport protein ExbD
MALHTASSEGDESALSEINITPLVDVMLVLLVAFIVTAPLMSNAIKLNLPKTAATQPPTPSKPITVSVDAHGAVFLDKEPVALDALQQRLSLRHAADPQLTLHLSADDAVRHGDVARVMALIERAGITKLAVLTQPS